MSFLSFEARIYTHIPTLTVVYFLVDMIYFMQRAEIYIGLCPLKGYHGGKNESDVTGSEGPTDPVIQAWILDS